MKHPLRRLAGALLAGALTVGLTVTTAAPAAAITGGTDTGPNRFTNVGLILFYAEDGRFRCSAALVSPTVLLTAAHCADGTLGKTLVTFDHDIARQAPTPFPVAANPAVGYTQAEIERAGYLSGTARTHPEYSDFTDLDNWNDVGVIVLDRAVTGLPISPIAEVGTLDAIPQRQFVKTLFTAVGYGTEVRKPEVGPQRPTPMSFPLRRQFTTMPGQKLTPQVFQTNGNPNDTRGGGGTCFGDSGGPVFLDGEIVGVTSYGYTANCRYLGGYQRVDIPVVESWLDQFGL